MAAGDLLVASTAGAGVFGIDANHGTTRWHIPGIAGAHPAGTTVAAGTNVWLDGSTLYGIVDAAPAQGQTLAAIDPRTGAARKVGLVAPGTEAVSSVGPMSGSVLMCSMSMADPTDLRLAAYDLEARKILWTRPRRGGAFPALAADRHGFYVAETLGTAETGDLIALDARTGKQRWGTTLRGTSGQLFIAGGMLVARYGPASDEPHQLLGISPADGTTKWRLDAGPMAQAAATGTHVYLLGADYSVRAVDPSFGKVRWHVEGKGAKQLDPSPNLIAASDRVVAAAIATGRSKGFRVLSPANGKSAWTYTLPGDISTSYGLAVVGDIICLLTSGSRALTGFRA